VDIIGERLRSAREARKLTIKEVSKQTNVIAKYIEALENEDFDKFPGETYVLGFLRTYADFLKLDVEEILRAYKGFKISESATPLEELTRPTKPSIMVSVNTLFDQYRNIVYIAGISTGILLLVWLFSAVFSSNINVKDSDSIDNIKMDASRQGDIKTIRNLQLSNDSGMILAGRGEAIQFLVDTKEVMFLLKSISDKSVTIELLPGNAEEKLEEEKPKTIKIENCPREVTFTLKGLTENRAKIMVALGEQLEMPAQDTVKDDKGQVVGDHTKVTTQSEKNLRIVFEVEFNKQTYLDLYLDGVNKRKGLVQPGTREKWEAVEYIQVKIGNAGGVTARINGKPHVFGLPGQVANKVITWRKDSKNPNEYKIVVKDW